MAKKVLTQIKLQAVGGQASPAPPVGPALGQHGVNIMEFVKSFNAQTQADLGTVIPVVITVYEDRSFTFVTKSPPAAVLIKQALSLEKGSVEPHRDKVAKITRDQLRQASLETVRAAAELNLLRVIVHRTFLGDQFKEITGFAEWSAVEDADKAKRK